MCIFRFKYNEQVKIAVFAAVFYAFSCFFLFSCSKHNNAIMSSSQEAHRTTIASLKRDVEQLSEEIGVRNIDDKNYQSLRKAADYIIATLRGMQLNPKILPYTAHYKGKAYEMVNIELTIHGTQADLPIIVMGAHYDTVNGSPGADDNATSVAALLALAAYMKPLEGKIDKTLKLVFFPNEEEPFNLHQGMELSAMRKLLLKWLYGIGEAELPTIIGEGTKEYPFIKRCLVRKPFGPNMGSVQYAKEAKRKNEPIAGMIALDAIGYFDDKPGSQTFPACPWLFKWLGFSDQANFVSFISNLNSRSFLQRAMEAFQGEGPDRIATNTLSLPECRLVRRSDHKPFWDEGYCAILITDTANFRNKNYHRATDRSDTLNYPKFVNVVKQLQQMVHKLVLPIKKEKED